MRVECIKVDRLGFFKILFFDGSFEFCYVLKC